MSRSRNYKEIIFKSLYEPWETYEEIIMDSLEKLAQKLGISVEELKERIEKNKSEEEDKIEANAKKKNN